MTGWWAMGLVTLALGMSARQASAAEKWQARIDRIIGKGLAEQRYPGAVVLVGCGDATLYQRAYGRHTYEPESAAMAMDTLFDLASITKVVGTTPAALLMVHDGLVKLDDPVAAYVPGFEANGKGEVTLRDLMAHMSGLKAYETWSVVEHERSGRETPAQALWRHYAALKLSYRPRTRVTYSCLNMQTLAAALQLKSGRSLEEILREQVWQPLGMRDTTYRPTPAQAARCAPVELTPEGRAVQALVHDPLARYHGSATVCPGNAGLFSTAPDLARYVRLWLNGGALEGKSILDPALVREATSIQSPAAAASLRGLGWDIYNPRGTFAGPGNEGTDNLVFGHTGYTGTFIWVDKHTRRFVILLTNRVFPSPATGGGEGKSIELVRRDVVKVVRKLAE